MDVQLRNFLQGEINLNANFFYPINDFVENIMSDIQCYIDISNKFTRLTANNQFTNEIANLGPNKYFYIGKSGVTNTSSLYSYLASKHSQIRNMHAREIFPHGLPQPTQYFFCDVQAGLTEADVLGDLYESNDQCLNEREGDPGATCVYMLVFQKP